MLRRWFSAWSRVIDESNELADTIAEARANLRNGLGMDDAGLTEYVEQDKPARIASKATKKRRAVTS